MGLARRLVLMLALVAALLAVVGPANAADGDNPPPSSQVTGTGSGSTGTLTGVQPGTQGSSSGSSGSSGSGSSGSGSGPSNTGLFGSPGSDTTGALTGSCDPALYPGGYSPNFAVPAPCIQPACTVTDPATGNQVVCPATPGVPAPPVVTTQMVVEAARVVAPVNPPHVEPGTLSFVNIPNNYWATAPTVNGAVTVVGVTIPLVWTPTGTTWSFGDGASATGNGIQDADVGQAGAIEHAYTRQGSYAITTATSYNLTFMIPGAGAQTIALTSPPSPAVTLPVREIQTLTNYVN